MSHRPDRSEFPRHSRNVRGKRRCNASSLHGGCRRDPLRLEGAASGARSRRTIHSWRSPWRGRSLRRGWCPGRGRCSGRRRRGGRRTTRRTSHRHHLRRAGTSGRHRHHRGALRQRRWRWLRRGPNPDGFAGDANEWFRQRRLPLRNRRRCRGLARSRSAAALRKVAELLRLRERLRAIRQNAQQRIHGHDDQDDDPCVAHDGDSLRHRRSERCPTRQWHGTRRDALDHRELDAVDRREHFGHEHP